MMRKICVVTGSRAEYGLLYWLMKEIVADTALKLQLIVTGSHLSPPFGLTYRDIERDGFSIDRKVEIPLSEDTTVAIARATGMATARIGETLAELEPDMVVLLGDRYEILAAATAATICRIPIAHIHGGEETQGATDDSFRHAITKMSLLHFAAAEPYRQRILRMGESPDRVFCVGTPALDNVARLKLLGRNQLEEELGFLLGHPTFLVTFHPVTRDDQMMSKHLRELLAALDAFPEAHIVFTLGNADPENRIQRETIENYVVRKSSRTKAVASLGTLKYLSLMQQSDVVIGNSSSGIIEAPALKKPTVNIGDRQKGRLMASSILQANADAESIRRSIERALSSDFQETLSTIRNPYEKGGASVRIKEILKDYPLTRGSLKKEFYRA